jgi:hypothetical protein
VTGRDGTGHGSVLVAYALLQWPLRATVADHLYSFRRYGTHPYEYVNLAVPGLVRAYAGRRFDAVVWHTSVLSWLRWPPESQLVGLRRRAAALRGVAPVHVALPQDEFLHNERVNGFLEEIGVGHVFSVAPPSEWRKIYAGLDVGLSRVLTGYLDDATVARIDRILGEGRARTIDIGYRTVPGKPYLGRHAALKADLADAVRERAEARGLRVDISTRAEDTFYGDDWYRFLASCRFTIGMEGGASILDRDGSVRACVDTHLAREPRASFAELEAACFPGRDGELALFALSPRHLEACATRTPQILVEGEYSGVLAAGKHYVELRRDLSNLDAVLDLVAAGGDEPARMAERAHAEVVASRRYTYERLVQDVERELPPSSAPQRARVRAATSQAVDAATQPLIPLATRGLMPTRRRLLGALGSPEYERNGAPARPRHVGGVLVLYHRPIAPLFRDASTVVEHATSFQRHSRLGVVELNTHAGLPAALRQVSFDAIVLHYSLFGMTEYRLDDDFLDYLRMTDAYKVVFFQDEYVGAQKRFRFLNEFGIDCLYTCLEPEQFDAVYGRYTSVPTLRPTLTGYVGDDLLAAAGRFGKPDADRSVDVGYRGRPLPAYLGRGAQEKELIGRRFAQLAAGSGLRLDIKTAEADRLYGDAWYRFVANCRCVLGVESGASAFDMEGEVLAEYRELLGRGVRPTVDDLQTLRRWDGVVDLRTISPRHFEAAAFRVCQVMFEGRYAGALEPMRHYIPLRKDFSNFDEVVGLLRDPSVRAELTENAYRDLIASGQYDYASFVAGVDDTLEAAGVGPLRDPEAAHDAVARGRRLRHLRSHIDGGLPELLRAEPAKRLMYAAEPVTLRVRKAIGRPRPSGLPDG